MPAWSVCRPNWSIGTNSSEICSPACTAQWRASDREPAAALAREPRSRPLEATLSVLAAELGALRADRLAGPWTGPHWATVAPWFSAPGTTAPFGPPPESDEAALLHPAVVRALGLSDQEIQRLRRALCDGLSPDRARDFILNPPNIFAASSGPVFLPTPSPAGARAGGAPGVVPQPPPWSQS